MSDRSKPWLETWRVHGDMLSMSVRSSTASNVRLAAAAPALARALCLVEWATGFCEACVEERCYGHEPTCYLDAALTAAGLTAEDREEVRRG